MLELIEYRKVCYESVEMLCDVYRTNGNLE